MARHQRQAALALAAFFTAAVLIAGCGSGSDSSSGGRTADPAPSAAANTGHGMAALPRVDRLVNEELRPIPGVRETVVADGGGHAAYLVRARGDAHATGKVVVFLGGWSPLLSSPRSYGAWVGHLARSGATVIFPVYIGPHTLPPEASRDAIASIAAGLHWLARPPRTIVLAGITTGGAIAFDYAAAAGHRGLPQPAAIYAVFPARNPGAEKIPPIDPGAIDPRTRIDVLGGAGDPVLGGQAQARQMLAAPRQVPKGRRHYLGTGPDAEPTESTLLARHTFWAPLDRLISIAERDRD